ncbi:MAG: type II pantothenate kinase [archaeon]|nr:type II pantothenate kinase [archaeon]
MDSEGNSLRFLKFPSNRVVDFIKFLITSDLQSKYGRKITRVNATGGGSFKYASIVKENLGIEMVPQDEMRALLRGLHFLVRACQGEVFTWDVAEKRQIPSFSEPREADVTLSFPYLLVNIGSGVSILRIDSETSYERVSGSSIGGGTFWGLCRQITGIESYRRILELAEQGNNGGVDLLVGDIYGGSYASLGLPATVIASSFAKCGLAPHLVLPDEAAPSSSEPHSQHAYQPQDVARSLIYMVANNVTQVAFLNAKLHNVSQIFFVGGFVQENRVLWERITFGLDFWSRGSMKAHFLLHDGYLGALGSLLAPPVDN